MAADFRRLTRRDLLRLGKNGTGQKRTLHVELPRSCDERTTTRSRSKFVGWERPALHAPGQAVAREGRAAWSLLFEARVESDSNEAPVNLSKRVHTPIKPNLAENYRSLSQFSPTWLMTTGQGTLREPLPIVRGNGHSWLTPNLVCHVSRPSRESSFGPIC